jgi:hypothetical protein
MVFIILVPIHLEKEKLPVCLLCRVMQKMKMETRSLMCDMNNVWGLVCYKVLILWQTKAGEWRVECKWN